MELCVLEPGADPAWWVTVHAGRMLGKRDGEGADTGSWPSPRAVCTRPRAFPGAAGAKPSQGPPDAPGQRPTRDGVPGSSTAPFPPCPPLPWPLPGGSVAGGWSPRPLLCPHRVSFFPFDISASLYPTVPHVLRTPAAGARPPPPSVATSY